LPVAELSPVLAEAVPKLSTVAAWLPRMTPPPMSVALAVCSMTVTESLPMAVAAPVLTPALPSEVLLAMPSFDATVGSPSPSAVWPTLALFCEALPVTFWLLPVLAEALPLFETPAF
jgi:hypothetical protein